MVLLVTAALGALVVFVMAAAQPDVVEVGATVVAGTSSPIGGDRAEVDITWSSPDQPVKVTETVVVPRSEMDDGIVSVWVDSRGEWSLVDPTYEPSAGDYLLAVGIGLLFGFVMVMTIRGYGYVRGDGEPGSKPEFPVSEDRGFYWRT